ncbi:hypothetical protein M758_10G010600 [Ceratodon purpureus]|uniref:Secreted protein n=1 Tax=Ceratodon purpureus TaxID=3225 RepID=A0A8T0GMD5_CERPU|nr:hypothetical protein KC19_10G011300 [Ceratodon purpureus]KAG0602376.1 hypothetical protein M758_10G010600 [Ceratodon purpureus]
MLPGGAHIRSLVVNLSLLYFWGSWIVHPCRERASNPALGYSSALQASPVLLRSHLLSLVSLCPGQGLFWCSAWQAAFRYTFYPFP